MVNPKQLLNLFPQLLRSKHLPVGMLLLCLVVSAPGCSKSSGDTESLEKLKTENTALKQQVADLQAQLHPTTTASNLPVSSSASSSGMAPSNGPAPDTNAGGFLTPSPQAFKDVGSDVPTADMINDMAQLKVFEGMGPEFKPYQTITRSEYITWLFKAYNAIRPPEKRIRMAPGYAMPYTDILPSDPAYKYVQAFGNAGFSVGYEDRTFKPNKILTREEMIAIKHGVDGGEMFSNVPTNFSDDKQIDPKYHNSVYSDEMFKDDSPRGNNIRRAFGPIKAFKPKEPVQRYEAAATLWQTDHRGHATADVALGRKDPNA
ncbi:MAG: S-layer homology domain-containing protein [Cyanobacteria bacterium]|nr:S-layer homology domain-containing protein [Cyanobacteriota bacterium]